MAYYNGRIYTARPVKFWARFEALFCRRSPNRPGWWATRPMQGSNRYVYSYS